MNQLGRRRLNLWKPRAETAALGGSAGATDHGERGLRPGTEIVARLRECLEKRGE